MAAKAERKCVNMDEKWRYCSVCRRNHDEGRKHIFTKQHKNRLSVILSKFTKKVDMAICTASTCTSYIRVIMYHAVFGP